MIGLLLAGTMAASLMISSLAMADKAQETESEQTVSTSDTYSVDIEDGIMTVRIDSDSENDQYEWQFAGEDMDDSSIELITDSTQDGHSYVGSFKAVDGCENKEENLRLIHTDGFCTDRYMDFQVTIEDGKIVTLAGGTSTPSTPIEEIANALSGTWQERSEGKTMLDIALGKNGGLDMVMSDGSGKDTLTQSRKLWSTTTALHTKMSRSQTDRRSRQSPIHSRAPASGRWKSSSLRMAQRLSRSTGPIRTVEWLYSYGPRNHK